MLILFLLLFNCSTNKKNIDQSNEEIVTENSTKEKNCADLLRRIQEELFNSNSILSGADSLISHLENSPNFIRNKEYDFGNGSVRFNSKNAKVYDYELIDEKSLFLINYNITGPDENEVFLFQAIYYFKRKEDQLNLLDRMVKFLNNETSLIKTTHYDIEGNPYNRYYLPCGSGINFKFSPKEDKRNIINILWISP